MTSWLKIASEKFALRKGLLRSDIHVAVPSKNVIADDLQLENLMKSFLQVATIRGLDIIGIVSDWLRPGQIAQNIAKQKNIDIFVLAGQEIISKQGLGMLVFNVQQELPQRLDYIDYFKQIHQMGGMVIVIRPSRRWVQKLNKIVNEEWAPDGIEVYNPHFSEYIDIDADPKYEFFMSSKATKPLELLESKINTQNHRSWWVDLGIMSPDTGENYVPGYLADPYRQKGAF